MDFKEEFIKFLLDNGSLKLGSEWKLKSGRESPYFINIGDLNDGESLQKIGNAFATEINKSITAFDKLYGIPEKGDFLAVATSIGLTEKKINIPIFKTRKEVKLYGESTNLSHAERIKSLVVGRAPKKGDIIIQLDDVFTAGDAKYEARSTLESLGKFNYPLLIIAVDRQEVGIDGKSAIEEYTNKTETKVISVINAENIFKFLNENVPIDTPNGKITKEHLEKMLYYLRVYGTSKIKNNLFRNNSLEQKVINEDRTIILACDFSEIERFEELVKLTAHNYKVGGYKIGFELGLTHGLSKLTDIINKYSPGKAIIYDHQKAGTDIPDTGKNFAKTCKNAGIDSVIFFPQAGPETERAWIYQALLYELKVIVGGRMTHPAYAVSEGGFITDEGAKEIYRIAARSGVNNFVVPGNKLDVIKEIKELIIAEGIKDPVLYSPGFVAQGGKITDAAKVAGDKYHAIVGRGIFASSDIKSSIDEYTSQI